MEATNPTAYLSFFDLQEQPFAPTADPFYFYSIRSHKECLFRLWSTIDERHGIAIVLGDAGTGKTMLLRKLLSGMAATPDQYHTALIGSALPSWTTQALLAAIVAQFGLSPAEPTVAGYIESLNAYLLANRDHVNTLVIDDAQNLNKRGQLELLRLIQNLETQQHKLLNVVLFAQLEWLEVLRAASNFAQRANVVFTLEAMSREETAEFIDFRLRTASAPFPIFDNGALDAIYVQAAGNPRVTVTLCRNALLMASRLQSRTVGAEIVSYTVEKAMAPPVGQSRRSGIPAASPVQSGKDAASTTEPAAPEPPAQEAEAPFAGLESTSALKNSYEARATQLLRAAKAKRNKP